MGFIKGDCGSKVKEQGTRSKGQGAKNKGQGTRHMPRKGNMSVVDKKRF
jgi:hypothetical protein